MLSKICFDRCMNAILAFADVPIDMKKNQAFYSLLKNDFEDAEFTDICCDICKHENLFNRYPIPKMFYDRKITKSDMCSIACSEFVEKISDYLSRSFVTETERENIIENMSEQEQAIIRKYGGLSVMWSETHRDNCPRSVSSILRDVKDDFVMSYSIMQKTDSKNVLENKNNVDKLNKLICSSVKKI